MQIDAASRSLSLTSDSLAIDSFLLERGYPDDGQTNFGGDNGFHPVSERKRRDAGWLSGSGSVGPEHPWEFFHPFSRQSTGFCWRLLLGHCFTNTEG